MKKQAAFTLLEVLVALAILAVALSAAIRTSTINAENARYLRDKTLAHWVAVNIVTEMRARGELPSIGKKTGTAMMADRKWFWVLQISKTIDEKLRRLEIRVYYDQDFRDSEESITIFASLVLCKKALALLCW